MTQVLANVLVTGSLLLMVALSFNVVYYPTKFFNIFQGAVITLGAYLYHFFFHKCSFPFLLAVVSAIISGAMMGALVERLIYRHSRRLKTDPLRLMIVSIALHTIAQNIISLLNGDEILSFHTHKVQVGYEVAGAYFTDAQIVMVTASMFFCCSLLLFFKATDWGKKIRALSSNPDLCLVLGVDINKTILVAVFFGSLLAASIGVMIGFDSGVTPTTGLKLLLQGVVVLIIGGVGNTKGIMIGAFFVSGVQHTITHFWGNKWVDATTYFVLILFFLWRPLGFGGKRVKKIEI